MPEQVVAGRDPALSVRVVDREPLYYHQGPDPELGRPAYVRAGSSLVRVADYFAVVQDDAHFVALVDPETRRAESLPLPAGPEGHRLFGGEHGGHEHKLDLEACLALPDDRGGVLLAALGSGSRPQRERIVVVRSPADEPEVGVYDASAFYALLHDMPEFSGASLNIEGAIHVGDGRIRLFQRGNAPPSEGLEAIDATCEVEWSELWAHLQDPEAVAPPEPRDPIRYRLGRLDGLNLNFSDAERHGRVVLFSGATEGEGGGREASGSALGVIDAEGTRWTELTEQDGGPFQGKVEGLSIGLEDPHLVHFVVDNDADEPSEIYEAELSGPWFSEGRGG